MENLNWMTKLIPCLRRHWSIAHWFFWAWPLCAIISVVYLIGYKRFDVVDRFIFRRSNNDEGIKAMTILIRNFGWHFFLPKFRSVIQQRILDAVLYAQEHVSVIGLGALTKDERITKGGKWIVDILGDRLHVPIVHGDTLTAMVVIQQALALIEKYRIKSPVFLTGSTSKIGRAVALYLAGRGIKVIMYTQDQERFDKIYSEAGEHSDNLTRSDNLAEGYGCALWIIGKTIPSGRELLEHIPKGAVVLNFAVPNPLTKCNFKRRPDLHGYEGGLLEYNPELTTLHFTMRLRPGLTYACHAGTFVHAAKGWTHHEVGPVDIGQLHEVWQAAQELGFRLPQL